MGVAPVFPWAFPRIVWLHRRDLVNRLVNLPPGYLTVTRRGGYT